MAQKAADYLESWQGWEVGVGPTAVVVDEGLAKALKITLDAQRNAAKPCVVLGFKDSKQILVTSISPKDL